MTYLSLFERRLRISTGLILATYIIVHLANHSLGLVSLDVMETARETVTRFWRHWTGAVLLYGSLVTHFSLGLISLYRRSTLRIPPWEFCQLLLGLSIVPLLAGHVAATFGTRAFLQGTVDYELVIGGILNDPWVSTRQLVLILVAWSHALIGLHFFFRLFRGYRRSTKVLYPLAVLLPVLAILAVVRVGIDLDVWGQKEAGAYGQSGYEQNYGGGYDHGGGGGAESQYSQTGTKAANEIFRDWVLVTFYGLLLLTLLARYLRLNVGYRKAAVSVYHSNGQVLKGFPGQSILEIIRYHRIPHASVCGGRGRCTTCRIRVGAGGESLPAPTPLEKSALERIGAAPKVRLACQSRPQFDVHVSPLLPAHPGLDSSVRKGGVSGEEREIVAMFVDLRDSTGLAEQRMPYDVLFVLNRFFLEVSEALSVTHGHYAQFAGDGLLALYGLERGVAQGCRDALRGAVEMQSRLDRLNGSLEGELQQPLVIGIGVHCGEAIVGVMGPPSNPNYSAIGDHINAAARLESKTKEMDCVLIVSDAVVQQAGVDFTAFPRRQLNLRGKQRAEWVYVVDNPLEIARLLPE